MQSLRNKRFIVPLSIITMRGSLLACKFGLVIFIGRYLDLPSLGLYGLAAGAIALGPVIIGMGMVHLIMRDAVTLSLDLVTRDLRQYWCFVAAVYALMLAITGVVTVLSGASPLWLLIITIMLFEHLGADIFLLLSNLERPLSANLSTFLRGAAWTLLYVPAALLDPGIRSIESLFVFWLCGTMSAFVLFAVLSRSWPWKAAFSHRFTARWISNTVRKSFVIYVSDLSFVGSQYIDRYLVTLFLGLEIAGVYFLYWSVASAVSTFVSIVVFQMQRPLLIKAYHEGGLKTHRALTEKFMRTAILSTAVFSAAVSGAFYLLLPMLKQPTSVGTLATAFWVIMAGMAVRNVADFGALALFTSHRDRMMTLTNLVAVGGLVVAQLVLLPLAGLYGAGAAIFLAFFAVAVWRHQLLFRTRFETSS